VRIAYFLFMEVIEQNKALEKALRGSARVRVFGLTFDDVMRYFFGGNASMAVVVLLLILTFLLKEGAGFFGQNQTNLEVYRQAGLEFVDLMRVPMQDFSSLTRALGEVRLSRFKRLSAAGVDVEAANDKLTEFDAFASALGASASEPRGLVSDLTEAASAVKTRAQVASDMLEKRAMLSRAGKEEEAKAVKVEVLDYAAEAKILRGAAAGWGPAVEDMRAKLGQAVAKARAAEWAKGDAQLERVLVKTEKFARDLALVAPKMEAWRWDEPVPFSKALSSFLFGRDWLTASFWQDWYGILPLVTGSLLVALIAMTVAVPLAISAAIYISEVATPRERSFIKPYIEFISAIPSVVLGFFGIAVLGTALRSLSQVEALNWIPGFPMSERLNALTAGLLLAFTSVPTIFSLAEDALTNVPKHFKEASFALGATRFQTLVRVLIPASLSGIISAILLGFGRVIGETMVVLLCAGNRIAIPDFTEGMGVLYQPVHTMTGIIAQEMGEVAQASIHYRALFMVGIILFLVSLLINFIAQKVVRKYRISIG
jgi:phosphate transport system permease protein